MPDQATSKERLERLDWLIFAGIVALALVVRIIYVLQLRSSPYFEHHVMDPLYHHEWAKAFAEGRRFWEGPYFRAPLYPWLLGLIYKLFGPDNALAPRIIQAAIGSASCGLIFVLGRLAFSRAAGLIAGLLAAGYWVFAYYDAELLIPVLIVFLDLLLLIALLSAGRRQRWWKWGLCGVLLGTSAIARPNILLLAPVLVAWVVWLNWSAWRRSLVFAWWLFAGTMVPILPITIRNYVVGHDLVLIASQGGVNFYIGNNPEADGMSAVIKGDPPQWRPCYEAQIARAERAAGRKLKASEVSDWYYQQAWRFMRSQPRAAAGLMLRKLRYFWSRWETGNNQDLYFIVEQYAPLARWLPVRFELFAPLGVLGLLVSLGPRRRELLPLWAFVIVYMLSVVMFFVTARYRVPVDAVLMVLAGGAVVWLAGQLRRRCWSRLALAGAVLAGMGWTVAYVPPGVDRGHVQGLRVAGQMLIGLGQTEQGEQLLRESIRRAERTGWPVAPETWYTLGSLAIQRGDLDEAARCMRAALAANPRFAPAHNALGALLAAQGQMAQAIEHFRQAVALQPQDAPSRANLASAYARAGRLAEAAAEFRHAIRLDPTVRSVLQQTVEILRSQGRGDDARRLLESVGQ